MIECMNHLASLCLKVHDGKGGLRALCFDDLMALGFDNPCRAIGICPDSLREKLAHLGPRVEYAGGVFRRLSAA